MPEILAFGAVWVDGLAFKVLAIPRDATHNGNVRGFRSDKVNARSSGFLTNGSVDAIRHDKLDELMVTSRREDMPILRFARDHKLRSMIAKFLFWERGGRAADNDKEIGVSAAVGKKSALYNITPSSKERIQASVCITNTEGGDQDKVAFSVDADLFKVEISLQ